jgi:hypothetical protein
MAAPCALHSKLAECRAIRISREISICLNTGGATIKSSASVVPCTTRESCGRCEDAAGHDAFLLDALPDAGRRYTVSLWVIASTIERVGHIAAFEAAVRRGAEIDVFADPLLTRALLPTA